MNVLRICKEMQIKKDTRQVCSSATGAAYEYPDNLVTTMFPDGKVGRVASVLLHTLSLSL